jgi:starch synthase (maltosyl-transferring)
LITRVNLARRENPALQQLANLRFLKADNDQLLAYVKWAAEDANWVIVVVNLDPYGTQSAIVRVPPAAIGVEAGASYDVTDLLTGQRYTWRDENYVRLDPAAGETAHILRVEHAVRPGSVEERGR